MEWLERMNKALMYIEKNLENDIDISGVARTAYSSTFHFQRMFHMLAGVTVAEYIRKRKLTLAAQELASSNSRVLDIALKYGYDTPESFSKAFKKIHGIAPSAAREPGVILKAYPRLSFHISLKGDKDMNYRIIDREAFYVIGKIKRVTTKNGENLKLIPAFWDECNSNGTSERICSLSTKRDMIGICMDFAPELEEFNYMIAVEKTDDNIPKDMVVREIPASTWAIFESIGPMPDAIQDVWSRIFSEWFPATGYEHADAPELEVYPEADVDSENYHCEVWIPIIKK